MTAGSRHGMTSSDLTTVAHDGRITPRHDVIRDADGQAVVADADDAAVAIDDAGADLSSVVYSQTLITIKY